MAPAVDPVRAIADAVLYEGYVLWPYTRSAMKNQQRFTWGGVYPVGWREDRSELVVQCLVEGDGDGKVAVDVRARFLHVVRRQVHDASGQAVDELTVDGERHLSWDEAVEREVVAGPGPFTVPAGREEEALEGGAGTLVRSWEPLAGILSVVTRELRPGLRRLTVRVANTTPWDGAAREPTLRRTLCSTHAVLRVRGGAFVSLADPPSGLAQAAGDCRQEGLWPVLMGEPGERDTVLASPIILDDHPQIAPESPGDLFDGGEIDGLLVLSILALTDEEKAEMRASDPRTRAILERTEALTPEQRMALHGTVRELAVRR
ncbi:MAG: hypothetical protein MSC31_17855 [Solirubrobacteraceae bacterium MAG38_C4-C5]|nr:hypothetical protein [Candidatus Siliceabacter maunaloa]